MQHRAIARVLGTYLYCLTGALFVFFLVGIYFQYIVNPIDHPQPHSTWAFLITTGVCGLVATLCRFWWGGRSTGQLYRREGLLLVVVIWFITALFAALPFSLSGTLQSPISAYFEAMSGLTTTGASVITPKRFNDDGLEIPIVREVAGTPPFKYVFFGTVDPVYDAKTEVELVGVEAVSKALLLWRSFLNWIGGMGIVMLFLAILPALGVGGKVLYQAEMPGMIKDALTPRVRDTASLLWKLYLGFTIVEVVLLYFTNTRMSLFDSVAVAFSNISTGGFSVKNASIGAYESVVTDIIVMVFMLLGSFNFVLYVYILQRKFLRIFEPEFNSYVIGLIVVSTLVMIALVGTPEHLLMPQVGPKLFSWVESLRYGAFQVISLQSSTGFVTADFNAWPYVAQVLLLTIMFIGGMSGSTAGGMKVIRHSVLARLALHRIELIFRPQTVRTLRIGDSLIDTNRATTVLTFFFVGISLTLIGTFLLVADHTDPETALTVNACCINNIGAAFRMAGPTGTFAFLSPFGKLLSIVWMVLGRLEYFALLIIFLPDFWRRS